MRSRALLLLLALAACSDDYAPCSANGQCLPGYACEDKLCVPCAGSACGDSATRGVGPRGAVICGADDVCLKVPAGALDRYLDLQITRTSTPSPTGGLAFLSGTYEVAPTGEPFSSAATLEIPISTTRDPATISVYRSDSASGPWTAVSGSATAITATGNVTGTAFFTAGYAAGE